MSTEKPEGAVIEIIERVREEGLNTFGVIAPNEVRINGQKLLASSDDPVTVHEVSVIGSDVVKVTLTLFARRVVFEERGPEPETKEKA